MRRALALVAVAVLAGCGGSPPADRAADLVPGDALLYVHLSTDPDREQDRDLLARLRRLPAFAPVDDALTRARPWLGDEVAFAVTPRGTVAILAVRDEAAARRALPEARFFGRFARVGTGGSGKALSDVAAFAGYEHEGDRSADAYVAPGAARLLPAALRFLAGRPVVADVVPTDAGVRITARRIGGAAERADFEPQLLGAVPKDTFAYVGVEAFAPAALPAVARPLVDALAETSLSISEGVGDPVITLAGEARGREGPSLARRALAGLQGTVAAALAAPGEATGQIPVFEERDLGGGRDGYALTLAGGAQLIYAVSGTRVAVSGSVDGVKRALRDEDGIEDADAFNEALPDRPDRLQALAFVASSQLLELADAAGLDAVAAYRTLRPNLAAIRALGAVVRRQGNDTTLELNLLFP